MSILKLYKKITVLLCLALFMFNIYSCKNKNRQNKETGSEKKGKIEPVEVTVPKRDTLYEKIYFTSTIDPLQTVNIICESNGIINSINNEPGDKVEKNICLATLENSDLLLKRKELKLRLKQNLVKFEKIKKMFEADIATEDEYDAVKDERDLLEVQLAQLNNEIDKTNIKATIDGTVVEKFVEQGQYINVNTVLFKLMDLSEYEIVGNIPEKDMNKIRFGQKVDIYIPESDKVIAHGNIKKIYPVVSETSGTLKIEIKVTENMDKLKVGQFVKCFIIVNKHSDIIVVPKKSLVRLDKGVYVYKIDESDSKTLAKKVEVQPGFVSDDYVEIKNGVTLNDIIVTSGQFNLQDTGTVKIINKK